MEALIPILTNKYTWIGLAFAGLVTFYQAKTWNLEHEIQVLDGNIIGLKSELKASRTEVDGMIDVYHENQETITRLEKDIKVVQGLNDIIIGSKNDEIRQLKDILEELNEPVVYPVETQFENITVKIKESPDENDTTFNNLINIGS